MAAGESRDGPIGFSRRPYGAAGRLGLLTQDFILGYFRFLPTGGITAARLRVE